MEKYFMSKYFASRFIVDVDLIENKDKKDSYIILRDQFHVNYYIDKNNDNAFKKFKLWLNNIFLKGVSGTLTVFEYSKHENSGELILLIENILTTDLNQQNQKNQ